MLTEDYTEVVERGMKKVLVKQHREAPAVFKHRNVYYMVTSGCTSWNPNGALVHVAESMLGPWAILGDPCIGGDDEEFRAHTFFSQGSFVLPLPGLTDTFLFMADRFVSSPGVSPPNLLSLSEGNAIFPRVTSKILPSPVLHLGGSATRTHS